MTQRRSTGRGKGKDVQIEFGFGELFKGIGNFMDLVAEMAEKGESEISRTGEIGGPGKVRGVYGFSVRTGIGGTPTVERFGNIRETDDGPMVAEVREPLVDVFDEQDHILVVAELPGVAEAGIQVEVKDDILSLAAEGRDRKYAKEILLPAAVEPTSLQRSYQNGIVEVRLRKVE